MESVLTKSQFKTFTKTINYDGVKCQMTVKLSYDDDDGNGHNTFSITGEIKHKRDYISGGAIHDEIKKYFPEFTHLIKWYLCTSQGPMCYIENTLYFASNSASSKYKVGEPNEWADKLQFENSYLTFDFSKEFLQFLRNNKGVNFEVKEVQYKKNDKNEYSFSPKYTFEGFNVDWYGCPFNEKQQAEEFAKELNTKQWEIKTFVTGYQKSKPRDLDGARQSAIWPDATDEELSQDSETLKQALLKRLPALMKEFKHDMEALGFVY